MKTVYWMASMAKQNGWFIVKYWTKPDRSNALTIRTLSLDDEKIRRQIEDELGIKKFVLEYVTESGKPKI